MNKKANLSLSSIALSVFVVFALGTALEGYAENYSLTVINTGAGQGTVTSSPSGIKCGTICLGTFPDGKKVTLKAEPDTESSFAGWAGGGCTGIGPCSIIMDSDVTVTATFDLKTPEISLSTDNLEFDAPEVGKKVTKTLVISNIGTGNLIVSVSGLDGTGFSITGKSTFVIKPSKNYNLRVTYVWSGSALHATESLGTDERMSGSGESDRGAPSKSKDIEASEGIPLGPTEMILETNDPQHPEELVELAPLVPKPLSAVLNIENIYHFAACGGGNDIVDVTEMGQIQLSFQYLEDKGYFNIVCGSDTCKGVTNASGSFNCNGCTGVLSQSNIQWIIYGKLSKDMSTLTLDIFHASEPAGTATVTCPQNQPQVTPWSLHEANRMLPTVTMPYKQGAQKTVTEGPLGQETYTLDLT